MVYGGQNNNDGQCESQNIVGNSSLITGLQNTSQLRSQR